jgi:hypothetical protein
MLLLSNLLPPGRGRGRVVGKIVSGTWSVTPMTLPSVEARRKVAPVAPGQSRSGRGNLEQPVVDIWVSECPVLPFPEPRRQDDHRSKLLEFA